MTAEYRPLTDLEHSILEKILAADHPLFPALRSQLQDLVASTVGPWGSILLARVDRNSGKVEIRDVHRGLTMDGSITDSQGVPTLFTLFVDAHDQLSMLQIVKMDNQPFTEPIDVSKMTVDTEAR